MNRPLARARVASARSAPAMSRPRPANASVPSRRPPRRRPARRPARVASRGRRRRSRPAARPGRPRRRGRRHLRGQQARPGQRRAAEPLEDAVVPLVGGRDPEVDEACRDDRERERAGQQEVDRPAGRRVGRTLTEAKNSSTATGMTIVTSRFSPRRAVSRSSIPVWARVARERARRAGSCVVSRGGTSPPRPSGRAPPTSSR